MKTLKCHWCVLIRLFNCHSWTVLGSVWVLHIILSHVIHTFEPLFELIWFKHSKESWWSAVSVVPYSTAVAPAAISFEQISLGTICCPIGQQAQIHIGFHSWNLKMAWTRLAPYPLRGNWPWGNNPPICKASSEENGTGHWPVSCLNDSDTQERGLKKVKIQKIPGRGGGGGGMKAPDPLEAWGFTV